MKKYFFILVIFSSLFSLLGVTQAAERIQFPKGATSTSVTGSVSGYEVRSYLLCARAGQLLHLKLNSKNRFLYFALVDPVTQEGIAGGPVPETVTEWGGTLPKDGDYEVKVFLMRAEARRKGRAQYLLEVHLQ